MLLGFGAPLVVSEIVMVLAQRDEVVEFVSPALSTKLLVVDVDGSGASMICREPESMSDAAAVTRQHPIGDR